MSRQTTRKYCRDCRCYVLAERPGTNHVLHCILSIVTMGFWVPIWLLSSVRVGGWRCTRCGGRV